MAAEDKLDVLTIGFGALGILYSYLLEKSGKVRVTAVCRSNYEQVKEQGIDIESAKFGEIRSWRPHRVVRSPQEARDRHYAYVLCTFKCVPDLQSTSSVIAPYLLTSSSNVSEQDLPTIVLVQNGIGIEDEVRDALVLGQRRGDDGRVKVVEKLASTVISCVAWIGANLRDGTKVEHGPLEQLVMGLFPTPLYLNVAAALESKGPHPTGPTEQEQIQQAKLDHFADLVRSGGGNPELPTDIQPARWRKLLWNAAWGALSALSRCPTSRLMNEDTISFTLGVARRTMLEILYVARVCGYGELELPAEAVDEVMRVTLDYYKVTATSAGEQTGQPESQYDNRSKFKPSILLDLEAGRPMELDPIIGNVVSRAREHGIDTPRLDMVLACLKPSQNEFIAASRAGIFDLAAATLDSPDASRPVAAGVRAVKSNDRLAKKILWAHGAPVTADPRMT